MLDHLQTHRQLVFDLTANYLDPLRGTFERLAYLAGLRNDSGAYLHDRLCAQYSPELVGQVLASSHQEVFERLLEMPLAAQEDSLRLYLNTWPGSLPDKLAVCRERGTGWIPANAPKYLTELYCSNLNALLELLADNRTTVRLNT